MDIQTTYSPSDLVFQQDFPYMPNTLGKIEAEGVAYLLLKYSIEKGEWSQITTSDLYAHNLNWRVVNRGIEYMLKNDYLVREVIGVTVILHPSQKLVDAVEKFAVNKKGGNDKKSE